MSEQEIFLNKFSRAVRLNLLNVRLLNLHFFLLCTFRFPQLVAEQVGGSNNLGKSVYFSAFYLMYAKLEENHGLARHAMAVYERSTKAVLPEEQFEVRVL